MGARIAAAASAAAITIPSARTTSGPTAVSTSGDHSNVRISGVAAAQDVGDVARQLLHRHRALLEPRAPLGQPDPDHDALADVGERERGEAGRELLAGRLRRSSAAWSIAASATRTRSDGCDSSSSEKPGSSATPVSRPESPDRRRSARAAAARPSSLRCGPQRGAERIGVGRRQRAQQPVARDRDAAAHRVGAERRDAAAVGGVAAQPARDLRRDPAQRAREQHALALPGQPRAGRREREVGGDVVADLLAVEEREQRRDLVREALGQPVGEQPRVVGGAAVLERVGQAVAVVVERVAPEPRDRREHDEDRRRRRVLDRERNRRRALRRAHVEHVEPRRAARCAHLQLAARRLAPLAPRLGLADAVDAPAVRAPAGVDGELHELAGAHGVGRGLREQAAHADPGLAAHRARPRVGRGGEADVARDVAHRRHELVGPGWSGRPPAVPSHSPSRSPGGSSNAATCSGFPASVRITRMLVG